uniref:Photosystem II 10 kDa polypeptide, chloroplastic n=1 Tax=Aegilops tauschii subsp. strangulata TaxID=200361 RepID=A0A453PWF6_AEGTS
VYWPVAAPVLNAFLQTELASADRQSLRERARDGSLHDHLADCGADERPLPLPPGFLLRRRLQRWQEDQGRQAPWYVRHQPSPCMHATSNCCVLHMHALVTMRSMDGLSGLIRGNLCYSAGLGGGLTVDIDANGRKVGKKGVYQFVDKYGANVDGYR